MGGLTISNELLNSFNNPNSSLLGFLISAYETGALFGALAEFAVGDRYGRKPSNVVGNIVVTFGAIIQATSFGIAQFLVIPIWLAECTLPKSRGRIVAMQLSNMLLGLIIATWLVSFSFKLNPMATPTMASFYIQAESNGDCHAPSRACLRLQISASFLFELQEISYAITVESQEAGSWSDVFKDHGISGWQRVLIACTPNFFQQMSGVNGMSSPGPYIFENSVGLSSHNALLVSGGLQVSTS
ncbi:hypothetical protein V1527DRAFT_450600 [Lipomyces starkeyi]